MKQEIPWNRLAVEAFVIVASILLAFAIDAWWTRYQESIEEQELLTGLRAEFLVNQELAAKKYQFFKRHKKIFVYSCV
jgi:hypothetical protein